MAQVRHHQEGHCAHEGMVLLCAAPGELRRRFCPDIRASFQEVASWRQPHDCKHCRQMAKILKYHATICKQDNCPVYMCKDYKDAMRRITQRQEQHRAQAYQVPCSLFVGCMRCESPGSVVATLIDARRMACLACSMHISLLTGDFDAAQKMLAQQRQQAG